MKKNCYNCKHLDWHACEIEEGWICDHRQGDMKTEEERKFLDNLDRKEYREKAKRCCELKERK